MIHFFVKILSSKSWCWKMKMQLHQYPGGHQVDGLPPVLSKGNVGKCTSAWTCRWLLLLDFLRLKMIVSRKEKVFWRARSILIGGFKKFSAQIRSQIWILLNLELKYFWAKLFSITWFLTFFGEHAFVTRNFIFQLLGFEMIKYVVGER